jgi:hypothetical protein
VILVNALLKLRRRCVARFDVLRCFVAADTASAAAEGSLSLIVASR